MAILHDSPGITNLQLSIRVAQDGPPLASIESAESKSYVGFQIDLERWRISLFTGPSAVTLDARHLRHVGGQLSRQVLVREVANLKVLGAAV